MSATATPGAILLDKDGVLVDFHRTWKPAIKRAAARVARLAAMNRERREKLAARLLTAVGHDAATDTFLPGSVWAAGTQEELFDAWAAILPGTPRAAIAAEVTAELKATPPHPVVPPRTLVALLRDARKAGWKMAVVTNDLTASARATAGLHGYAHLLDAVIGADQVARPKPHPDLVRHAEQVLDLPAARMVMVGDNVHDGEMARAAGCAAFIGVTCGTSGHADLAPLATAVVEDVAAALRHILRLEETTCAR